MKLANVFSQSVFFFFYLFLIVYLNEKTNLAIYPFIGSCVRCGSMLNISSPRDFLCVLGFWLGFWSIWGYFLPQAEVWVEGQVFERAFPVVLASPKDYIYVGACICAHAQYKCVGMCVDNIHVEARGQPQSCPLETICLVLRHSLLLVWTLPSTPGCLAVSPGAPISSPVQEWQAQPAHLLFCYMGSKV